MRGAALAVAALWLAVGCAPEPVRHVVLISVDTLRADRLGAYGAPAGSTPSLDRLAAESTRFANAYAQSSKTLPSVATLMTGRLPAHHGLYTNLGALPAELPTLAARLRAAGFATAGFVGNYALRADRGLDRGFDAYTRAFGASERNRPQPENRGADLTDAAIAWLQGLPGDARAFLWVHYQEPHGPYTPARYDAPPDDAGPVLPANRSNSGRGGIPTYQWLGHGRLADYVARYAGEVHEVDRQIGRLLDALRARGLERSTALLFTADHGEAFGEDGLYCAHGEGLGDALLRVPLLLRLPGARAGVRDDAVRLLDVAPTLLALAGLDASDLPGRSLLEDVGDRTIVAQVSGARGLDWRRVRASGADLTERRGAPPRFAGADAAQRAALSAAAEQSAPWPRARPGAAALRPDERENLKALGYVD